MKKVFETPEFEILKFETKDIISLSGDFGTESDSEIKLPEITIK